MPLKRIIRYNPPVVRQLTTTALVVLVQFGAFAAPLTHVHLDAHDTAHHHGQTLHAHLTAHAAAPTHDGPIVDHQEDAGRTVSAQIFVTGAIAPFTLPALPAPTFVFVMPPSEVHDRAPHVAHGHDPPSLVLRSPRAPPASLS